MPNLGQLGGKTYFLTYVWTSRWINLALCFNFQKAFHEPANNMHMFCSFPHLTQYHHQGLGLHHHFLIATSSLFNINIITFQSSTSSLFNINIIKVLNMVRSHNMEDVLAELKVWNIINWQPGFQLENTSYEICNMHWLRKEHQSPKCIMKSETLYFSLTGHTTQDSTFTFLIIITSASVWHKFAEKLWQA